MNGKLETNERCLEPNRTKKNATQTFHMLKEPLFSLPHRALSPPGAGGGGEGFESTFQLPRGGGGEAVEFC